MPKVQYQRSILKDQSKGQYPKDQYQRVNIKGPNNIKERENKS